MLHILLCCVPAFLYPLLLALISLLLLVIRYNIICKPTDSLHSWMISGDCRGKLGEIARLLKVIYLEITLMTRS